MRATFIGFFLVLFCLALQPLVGCGRATNSRTAGATVETPDNAVAVRVAPVVTRPVKRQVHFVGTLYGQEEVTISSQIEGQVQRVHADLADEVDAGALLAEIDDGLWEARLREAEAQLAKARVDEVRARQLVADRIISPQEYEQRKTAADVALAQRDSLQLTVRHARVVSPLRAAVARRFVSAGEYVRPGSPLFTLVVVDPLKLRGEVPERFVPELAVGQTVETRVDAYGDQVFLGRLVRVAPVSNVQNRSVPLEALVQNPDRKLKPGFFANAAIVVRQQDLAVCIPQDAVVRFSGVNRVFVVNGGRAQAREVELGDRLPDGLVEVRSGLAAGESLIVTGLSKVEDGRAVRIMSAAPTVQAGRTAREEQP